MLDQVELLGRVSHADMPARMAAADVFVFPSLFEGSAVVTYEALACGLPSVVTAQAGSVVRDGIEGFVVRRATSMSLAHRMEQLGNTPELRARMAAAARLARLNSTGPGTTRRSRPKLSDLISRGLFTATERPRAVSTDRLP